LSKYSEAIRFYETALLKDDGKLLNGDNRELVKRRLEYLKTIKNY
jgi:hypothetical protein